MGVPMEIGKCYNSKMTGKVRVWGFYRMAVSGQTGVFFRAIGPVASGIHHQAMTLIEWSAAGFEEIETTPVSEVEKSVSGALLPPPKAKRTRKTG
jgi:hypothetical protein